METISRSVLTFLLNGLWQIPVVTVVALLACRLLRRGPASHRHAVWTVALVTAILLPLASVRTAGPEPGGPRFEVSLEALPAAGTAVAGAGQSQPPAPSPRAPENRNVAFAQTTAAAVLAGYALFLLYRLALLAWAGMRTAQLRGAVAGRATPPAVERVWMRCLEAFGLEGVALLWSGRVSSPITAGRSIVLPESLFTQTSEDVLATAIGHEMAHIARRDFVFHVLSEVLYLPISFHPAAWLIRREIERSREMACDELVIRKLMDPRVYAQSILSLAAGASGTLRPGYTLGVFDGDILEVRIRRLLERRVANLKHARLLLATGLATLGICAVIVSGLALTARAQGGSDEMRLAGEAYNRGDFAGAVARFESAVRSDPSNIRAKLFLANALMRQSYAAGGGQPESVLLLRAREQYRDILGRDPRNKVAVEGLMAVAFASKQLQEAREWALKLIELDPREKTGYYMAGVVGWALAYPEYQRAKQAAAQRPEETYIADANARRRLRDEHVVRVEESLRMLQSAIDLDPGYDDAMAYLNLSYRLKAAMVESASESAALIAKADEWLAKAVATRKQNAAVGPAGPSRLDVSGAPPGPAVLSRVAAPPPPPPPPPRAEWEDQAVSETAPAMPRNAATLVRGPSWQVAGETAMPAKSLLRLLSDKGFPAQPSISGPRPFQVRIFVGPYIDPKALEQAKLDLERAGFRPLRMW